MLGVEEGGGDDEGRPGEEEEAGGVGRGAGRRRRLCDDGWTGEVEMVRERCGVRAQGGWEREKARVAAAAAANPVRSPERCRRPLQAKPASPGGVVRVDRAPRRRPLLFLSLLRAHLSPMVRGGGPDGAAAGGCAVPTGRPTRRTGAAADRARARVSERGVDARMRVGRAVRRRERKARARTRELLPGHSFFSPAAGELNGAREAPRPRPSHVTPRKPLHAWNDHPHRLHPGRGGRPSRHRRRPGRRRGHARRGRRGR